ncbi:DUF2332 family protein [Seohaeicola saemankumensis]|nr:DUF2332 family protein [Seohaeicola saemankumensis]MCA0871857.1 DUF2332 family protein [Seohaeicola saemankumensis]
MSLPDAMRTQAAACGALGSPFMARLLTALADHWPATSALALRCNDWSGDIGPSGASLPLRIAGGLHALVLSGRDAALRDAYPPASVSDAELAAAVLPALDRHRDFLLNWIENAPQTNEIRRSAALVPALHWLSARHPGLPLHLSELGASAGLNLMCDRFALDTTSGRLGPADPALSLSPDWTGPLPSEMPVTVASRRGVDLNPLDPHNPDHRLRLFSYLWPDQPHRVELTRAAIAVHNAVVDRGDAIDWLRDRLAERADGLHLIYHTVAWQYFPADRQHAGRKLIEAAGERATPETPLAWLGMEADDHPDDGAALTLRLWPAGLRVTLARVDFHGRWVRWQDS